MALSADRASGIDPSILLLLGANLIPLAGVLFWGWSVFAIMVLFWLENVVVGLFNLPRILLSRGDGPTGAPLLGKVAIAAFFAVHYGIFTGVHGVFVFALFGGSESGGGLGLDAPSLLTVVDEYHLYVALVALVASHGYSFVANYLMKGEYLTATTKELMAAPYGRVVVLHLTVLGGGFVLMALDGPVWGLILLIALKTVMDIRAHRKAHEKSGVDAE